MRTRAGYPHYDDDHSDDDHYDDDPYVAPFTMKGQHVSDHVTDLLLRLGYVDASYWKDSCPVYHFIVAVTQGDRNSSFRWTSGRMEKVGVCF